jgi:serine/threonine protein phosphatase PrpC
MEDEWFIREKVRFYSTSSYLLFFCRLKVKLIFAQGATRTHPTFFGIFDGHSGVHAAQFVRDVLPDLIMKRLAEDADATTVLKESFVQVERMFLDEALTTGDRSGTFKCPDLLYSQLYFLCFNIN